MPLLSDSDKVLLGGTPLDAVYLGGAKVWPPAPQGNPAVTFETGVHPSFKISGGGYGHASLDLWSPDEGGYIYQASDGPGDGSATITFALFGEKNPYVEYPAATTTQPSSIPWNLEEPPGKTLQALDALGLVQGQTYIARLTWRITGPPATGGVIGARELTLAVSGPRIFGFDRPSRGWLMPVELANFSSHEIAKFGKDVAPPAGWTTSDLPPQVYAPFRGSTTDQERLWDSIPWRISIALNINSTATEPNTLQIKSLEFVPTGLPPENV
jgi:hypothetical protein